MEQKIDSKGRVVVPSEDRIAWQVTGDDVVTVEITASTGAKTKIRGKIDDRGRITIPKDKRDRIQVMAGDRVRAKIVDVQDGGYVCDDCGQSFGLGKVLIVESGERIVCAECSTPEDRIIT